MSIISNVSSQSKPLLLLLYCSYLLINLSSLQCRAGTQGWSFVDLLADFHLLLFLADHFSLRDDIPLICAAIVNREEPLNEGYQILIRSLAGLDI